MTYRSIRLVGGSFDGTVYTAWAGEGVFPVQRALCTPLPAEYLPTLGPDNPMPVRVVRENYTVHRMHVAGKVFAFATPVSLGVVEAARRFWGDCL